MPYGYYLDFHYFWYLKWGITLAWDSSQENLELTLRERVSLGMRSSWYNGDFGWANINDVAIHITLLFGAQFLLHH